MDYIKELGKQNEKQQKKTQSQSRHTDAGSSNSGDPQKPKREPNKQTAKSSPLNTNNWCMLIHLSQFCAGIFPMAGLVVPIILWQIKKDELPGIVPHTHVVLNWNAACASESAGQFSGSVSACFYF